MGQVVKWQHGSMVGGESGCPGNMVLFVKGSQLLGGTKCPDFRASGVVIFDSKFEVVSLHKSL